MLEGYAWLRQTAGQSGAEVFRLERHTSPPLFLKTEPASAFAELPAEAARLHWLAAQAISCPAVLAEMEEEGQYWLLMTALPGRDLASSTELAPKRVIEIAAGALRQLHGLDARRCPFDHRLDRQLELAGRRVDAGVVDEDDFDEDRLGRSAAELFDELLLGRPSYEDLVVSHGDATFTNLIVDGDRFAGFIDCARLGLADRHQDLALIIREIHHSLGEEWVGAFLRHYGCDADRKRLAFYQLLDEFF